MFNLHRSAQVSEAPTQLGDIMDQAGDQISGNPVATSEEIVGTVQPEAEQTVRDLAGVEFFMNFMVELKATQPEVASTIEAMPDYQALAVAVGQQNPEILGTEVEKYRAQGVVPAMLSSDDMQVTQNMLMDRARSLARQMKEQKVEQEALRQQFPLQAFNLSKTKTAQVEALYSTEERISAEDQFVEQYLPLLLMYNGQQGQEDAQSMMARNEILAKISPIAEENAESAIERIQGSINEGQAAVELRKLFRDLVAPHTGIEEQMAQVGEPQMASSNPDGIIKFNLSDHVLNNRMATCHVDTRMTKEAADHFGQYYLLYGPTEKRICPKMAGKAGGYSGTGAVVSEYLCRHHCLDGIVIDDNKTICGEALWRAHSMDKQSREYVDADGNLVGGYLNKRFEINRNVPEENKMRLKPGETRKPRPAAWGNLESRMQDMRNKQGQARDYRPDTNTGQPFEWCHDVDQNNVEQSQAERDRREEAMGHQTVQYIDKLNQENNNAKKAFNLRSFKKTGQSPTKKKAAKTAAQYEYTPRPKPGSHDEYREQTTISRMKNSRIKCEECGYRPCRCGTGEIGDPKTEEKKSFNLKHSKVAQKAMLEQVEVYRTIKRMVTEGASRKDISGAIGREVLSPVELNRIIDYVKRTEINHAIPSEPHTYDLNAKSTRTNKEAQGANMPTPHEGLPYDELIPTEKKTRKQEKELKNKKAQMQALAPAPAPAPDPAAPAPAQAPAAPQNPNAGKPLESWTVQEALDILAGNPNAQTALQYLQQIDPNLTLGQVWHQLNTHVQMTVSFAIEQASTQMPEQSQGMDMQPMAHGKFNLRHFKQAKEEGVTYKGEHFESNPWAVCNKSTGGKNEVGKAKFERCVQHVKDQDRDKDEKESMSSADIKDRGVKDAHLEASLKFKDSPSKPVDIPTVASKKKS